MPLNPKLIRAYDLRGVVDIDLTEDDARALGSSYAATLRERGGRRVAVGYDGRLSSPRLEVALVAGLVAGGAQVERIGCGPTGMLYFAVHDRGLDGGIMVTGSHNPPDQNGFKLLLGRAPVYGRALAALAARRGEPASGGSSVAVAIEEGYVARLLAAASGAASGAAPLRVGWDAGNGATGAVLRRLTDALPGEHHLLHAGIDGRFPAHHPDPSVAENLADLQALVRRESLDFGIAFDGDGDRIGVVDATGTIVWPDQLLLFLACDVLRDHPGATIIGDVKSSRTLFDGIVAAGGRAMLSPSGYVLVREAMLREAAPLAGEMSGHIFYADRWYGTDDALHVAMRLLAALGRGAEPLDAFRRALPATFATPELRLQCSDERKQPVLDAVARRLAAERAQVDRTDGLRVTTADGWWLLRTSGTEAKLTARVEAWSEAGRDRLEAELMRRLTAAGL